MDERINILRKYNLWGDTAFDFGFRRIEYNEKIMDFTGNRLVKILTGQRRAGKSYLLRQTARQLIENGVPAANTLFINREMTDLDFIKTYKDLDEIIKLYQAIIQPTGKVYIFIDEIQLIKDWEKTINSYSQDYTAEYELFISGSNSKLLSGELATLLSGRYVCFNVFPFSYQEYLMVTGKKQMKQSYLDYINSGGLPELFSLPNKLEIRQNYMSTIKDSILLRDIIQRYNIRDPKLLEDIFIFLVNNASNLISVNSIVKYFKNSGRNISYDIVAAYIGYIEDTFLIHRCERYDIKGKETLAGTSKFYINDLAYKNYLYPGYGYGFGYLIENAVYLELLRMGYEVYTGNDKGKEIDFVAQKTGETIYIQCSYIMSDQSTIKREFSPLETINDNFPKVVVSIDDMVLPSHNGIKHIQAWHLRNELIYHKE